MPNELLSIPINSIEADFDDFLSPDSNKRIIFSGPFGIGKTYFLDKFFKNRQPNYIPIFLRPVNYSLLSNEDVFRLIKYDILLQLINTEGFVIENEFEFSGLEYSNFFIGENRFLILQNLLKLIPKIQSTVDGIENFSKLIDAFKNGKKEINENLDLKMLFDFQHETQENFLLEYDHVSQFISNKLDEIVEENKSDAQLKKVLIIDDLDRLDPEHIFRLFNVFSAHFDHVNYYSDGGEIKDNKFGFDKIIFVCDIQNIRKIFAHKYGEGVDFSGYIDKFYSSRPYHFLNYSSINNFIYKDLVIKDIPIEANYFIQIICLFLMYNKLINIRKIENLLLKHQKCEPDTPDSQIQVYLNTKVHISEIDWIRHLSPLKSLTGSYESLFEILNDNEKYKSITLNLQMIKEHLSKTFIASSLYQSIRVEPQEGTRTTNRTGLCLVECGSASIKIRYSTFTGNQFVHISEFRTEVADKEHKPLLFSDFKSQFIATLKLGLKTHLLRE